MSACPRPNTFAGPILRCTQNDQKSTFPALFLSLLCILCFFVAIPSKKKRLFSGFTNADNVSNLDKLRKPDAQAPLSFRTRFGIQYLRAYKAPVHTTAAEASLSVTSECSVANSFAVLR
jgi:hypothetical protein